MDEAKTLKGNSKGTQRASSRAKAKAKSSPTSKAAKGKAAKCKAAKCKAAKRKAAKANTQGGRLACKQSPKAKAQARPANNGSQCVRVKDTVQKKMHSVLKLNY